MNISCEDIWELEQTNLYYLILVGIVPRKTQIYLYCLQT